MTCRPERGKNRPPARRFQLPSSRHSPLLGPVTSHLTVETSTAAGAIAEPVPDVIRLAATSLSPTIAPQPMQTVQQRLETVRGRITAAERHYHRAPGSVTLLAVTKGQHGGVLREAERAGQRLFGESYVQEALPKIEALSDLELEWHFIGRLQSNKIKAISRHFSWVHSVDSLASAQSLGRHRPDDLPPLSLCVQINVSGESRKSGVGLDQAAALAEAVVALPRVRLRGLMALPAPSTDFAVQERTFKLVYDAWLSIKDRGVPVDTLSMGMSADMEAAIAQGATLVRIGTDVFGPRPAKKTQ